MRVVGIIQARMGSKRLPGKSMMPLAGKPLLWQFIERVKRSSALGEIVLATTIKPEDDILETVASESGISVFRGSENDLVDRYYKAALEFKADIIVRLCADNPCIEPAEIDRILRYHLASDNDFSSNTHNIMGNEYPDGLGAEVYNLSTLKRLRDETTDPANREHPHSYVYDNPGKFRIGTVKCPPKFRRPDLKLDVNTKEEYEFIRFIYETLYPLKPDFHITDIIVLLDGARSPQGKQ